MSRYWQHIEKIWIHPDLKDQRNVGQEQGRRHADDASSCEAGWMELERGKDARMCRRQAQRRKADVSSNCQQQVHQGHTHHLQVELALPATCSQ